MSKISVVLIEDEPPARQVFRQMIQKRSDLFELVGEAENGEEGYLLIQDKRPALLVTDITMPVKDGLEMLREVNRSLVSPPYAIILTCHEDFHYAQQAIELGASSYLLKERCLLDEDLLTRTMENVIPAILNETEARAARAEMEKRLRIHELDIERNHFLDMLLGHEQEWLHHLERSGYETQAGPHSLFWIEFDRSSLRFSLHMSEELKLWQFAAVNVLREFVSLWGPNRIIAFDKGRFLVMCCGERSLEADAGQQISDILNRFLKMGSYVLHLHTSKPSELISLLPWIKRTYRERDLYFYEEQRVAMTSFSSIDSLFHFTQLPTETRTLWKDKLLEGLLRGASSSTSDSPAARFFQVAAAHKWSPHQVRDLFAEVMADLRTFTRMKELPPHHSGESDTLLIEALKDRQTLRSLYQTCSSYTNSFTDRMGSGPSIDRTVATIVQTIKEHPEHNYLLDELAESINYSANYFGQVFKKITGESLTSFVTHQRIERAKLLLLTSDRKTFEIAQDVGFPNYRHFNRLFKRIVGCSPTEFRDNDSSLPRESTR
ncbi:response regulator transcription factor [Paenibacillus qinlingensis]|uniref:response regulator transcription factor n=1 Tax=Paenibacillus qinlingensis TaxID=1837343 RepID=UPI001565A105|nr:helix-turn-helix domain-containing protein [Paenibacillus qinlingensis]NQX59794.1 helix-turn-helix domain-containing protein [Paenibacillus qinlingensis]